MSVASRGHGGLMYLEIDEDFPTHPKSVRLCAALNNPVAWAYMIKLWSWARKYQKDGDLSAYTPEEIEVAVGWAKVDGKFYAAAVRVGFIDEMEPTGAEVIQRWLHNWLARTGGAIRRMDDEATRKRLYRLHNAKKCDPATCPLCAKENGRDPASSSDGRPPDGPRTGAGRPPDGPDQDKASQDKASQDKIDRAPTDSPRIPAASASRRWGARDWFERFKKAWAASRRTLSYGGPPADFKAVRDLQEMLDALTTTDALAAQERSEAMFEEYLADRGEKLVAARHPWSWFVSRFNGLRIPRQTHSVMVSGVSAASTDRKLAELRSFENRTATAEQLAELRENLPGTSAGGS
jgi:hypothetical protein